MTIRWGIIGCGDVVKKRVAAAVAEDPRSSLLALCRRDATQLQRLADEYDVECRYTDERQLFEDSAVDAVYIATPVADHSRQTLAAAAAGKHVLVEKPMALSVTECRQMIDACRAAGVILGVAYYRPFYPIVQRMKRLIEDGAIGKPLAVSALSCNPLQVPPGAPLPWRVRAADGGGGPLMDIGSHRIDLFQEFFGTVDRAHGYRSTLAADYEVEDSAAAVLQFAGGEIGTLQCFFGVQVDPDRFFLVGTEGNLCAEPLNGDRLVIRTSRGEYDEQHPPPTNLNAPLIADFTAAIQSGQTPKIDGQRGCETNRIIAAIYAGG
jgi:predicted dehydrogenase